MTDKKTSVTKKGYQPLENSCESVARWVVLQESTIFRGIDIAASRSDKSHPEIADSKKYYVKLFTKTSPYLVISNRKMFIGKIASLSDNEQRAISIVSETLTAVRVDRGDVIQYIGIHRGMKSDNKKVMCIEYSGGKVKKMLVDIS